MAIQARWRVRIRLQTLRRDEGRWPTLSEYRALAGRDHTLPRAKDVLALYGSWTKASADVLDPRTPEGWDLDALYADYQAGTTQTDLAERLGVNAETVRVAFLRAGLPKRSMREVNAVNTERAALKAQKIADNLRQEVVSAYRKVGVAIEVAQSTGIGYGLVQRILREEGVLYPRRHCSARDTAWLLRAASRDLGARVTVRGYRALALKSAMPDGQPWPKSERTLMHALGTRTWNETLHKAHVPVIRFGG